MPLGELWSELQFRMGEISKVRIRPVRHHARGAPRPEIRSFG